MGKLEKRLPPPVAARRGFCGGCYCCCCLASPSFLPWDRSRVSSTSSESLSDGQMTCGGCCFYCAKRREEEENVGSLSNQLWNEKGIAFFSMPLLKPSTTRRNILLLTLCYVLFYTYTKLASKLWRVACGYGIALQASYYRHSAWSWMAVPLLLNRQGKLLLLLARKEHGKDDDAFDQSIFLAGPQISRHLRAF